MSQPDTFEAMGKRWRENAQSDREKTFDINARLQRGETVLINSTPYGPYKDLREACADELASLAPNYVSKERVRELLVKWLDWANETDRLDGRDYPNVNFEQHQRDLRMCAGDLVALLGEPVGQGEEKGR